MHSPSRFRSLRSAGIAAILSAGLVIAGTPLAAFADDDGSTGSASDTGTTGASGGDDAAGQSGSSGTESGSTDSGPGDVPAPQAPAGPNTLSLLDIPAPTHTVSGVTRDGYGRLLAGVPVTLNQRLGDGSEYEDGGYSEITTVFSTTSDSHGAFSFTVPDDYYILCLDMADNALYNQDRCKDGLEVNGADVTGLVGGLAWRNAPAPTPDNAADLALTGLRAAGQAVTWNEAPDWSSFESETGFEMVLGASLWTVDGEFPDLQHSSPVETSHTLTAGDSTSQVSVRHFYAADLPVPDAGWFTSLTLTLTLPMPSAPAADSTALRQAPRGGVSAPASNTEGGSIAVTVGASHNGETVDGWLYSTPTYLGQAVVVNGVARFTLPTGMTGSHTIAAASGATLIGWAPVTISANALASTGVADVVPLLGLGMSLLIGGALLLLARRRHQAD